jgi:hypothetical protein
MEDVAYKRNWNVLTCLVQQCLSYLSFTPVVQYKFCYRRSVRDPQTGQDVVLSDADVDIIQRLQAQKIPDANFDDAAVSTLIFSTY